MKRVERQESGGEERAKRVRQRRLDGNGDKSLNEEKLGGKRAEQLGQKNRREDETNDQADRKLTREKFLMETNVAPSANTNKMQPWFTNELDHIGGKKKKKKTKNLI